MTYEEALNHLWDYGLDEEGEEIVAKLENALKVLRILKKRAKAEALYPGSEKCPDFRIVIYDEDDEYETIREWLEGE